MWSRAAFAAGLLAAATAAAQTEVLPRPDFANSVHVSYYCLNKCFRTDAKYDETVQKLKDRVGSGPYARLGLNLSVAVDMPWTADLANPALTSPSMTVLRGHLDRAAAHDIHLSLSVIAGITRSENLYSAAVQEDRRNYQWLSDGRVEKNTPSRYARKLRRHLEVKVRMFAEQLATLIAEYPETFGFAAGDGETELSSIGLDESKPYEEQVLSDYSPFAVLEFRDWVRHTGMYGSGGVFAGQGRPESGERYADPVTGLAAFNADFGTAFATWDLEHFTWSLDDPVDGDPRAITASAAAAPGWSAAPTSGPDFIAGGFDAPRTWNEHSAAFWQLWLAFRERMIANYVRDFTTWVMTTINDDGLSVPYERWFTYQIPADYLYDTYPGCPNPDRRYLTSASPAWTALEIGDVGSIGFTAFDGYRWPEGYTGTTEELFADLELLDLDRWGLIEFNFSWPLTGIDVTPDAPANTTYRAYELGSAVFAYYPWPLDPEEETTPNLDALGMFVARVKYQPRETPRREMFVPPRVTGMNASIQGSQVNLSWSERVFSDRDDFAWVDWPAFDRFEVWSGTAPEFAVPAEGYLVGTTTGTSLALPIPPKGSTYFKVVAVNDDGAQGEASTPVSVDVRLVRHRLTAAVSALSAPASTAAAVPVAPPYPPLPPPPAQRKASKGTTAPASEAAR